MRKKLSYKIKDYNKQKFINKKKSINKCNLNYISTMGKGNSENISSEYNLSGIGGYGLNLI
ncbi:hypothetical protein [Clostridium sp. D53t1_180928_C8]|uniref:hypothetical protein n=1 Tax=Clostridium sp. D53t1_180928_C8 TaxID=2787101 RepID=UPI0018ABADA7|nr:hypothetical protein [Clostridium sp. D53t1_180928_C8]